MGAFSQNIGHSNAFFSRISCFDICNWKCQYYGLKGLMAWKWLASCGVRLWQWKYDGSLTDRIASIWISDQGASSNTFREGNYAVEAILRPANHLVNA